jgi:hypothetical protein
MNISANTLAVLKSFTTINPSIAVNPGSTIRTISPQKTIMATAEVVDAFDSEFAIYDLNQFLSAVSLFENPDFSFNDTSVTISSEKSSIKYFFADRNMVMQAPEKQLTLPDVVVDFTLTSDVLKATMQAASVFQAPNWAVVGNGSTITLEVGDVKNPTSNKYKVEVGNTDNEFELVFKVDNLKIMLNTYTVKVSSKGVSHFATEKGNLNYYIATESIS